MIKIEGESIVVRFNLWGLDAYKIFLQSKKLPEYNLRYDHKKDTYVLTAPSRFAHVFGIETDIIKREWLPLNEKLFDYQKWIIYNLALPAKRFGIWLDTGLGKAFIMLELARQVKHKTGGKVLLVTPLNLIQQTIDESIKFYGLMGYPTIKKLNSRTELKTWCKSPGPGIAITNPEKFIPRKDQRETISEVQYLCGVCLDEASLLKSSGGRTKWALIKSCRGIEYKYSFTATPAPNDTMEYASQGSFLEKLRSEGEIIWTFFIRDKEGNWKIKENAREAFYRFLSGWSIYMREPKQYGFEDNLKDLPAPIKKEYRLKITPQQLTYVQKIPDKSGQLSMFPNEKTLEMTSRIRLSEIAKGFLYNGQNGTRKIIEIDSKKPQFIADLAKKELEDGLKLLIWTIFDEESSIIFRMIKDLPFKVDILTGKIPINKRLPIIEAFRTGESDCVITKASLLGYGLNFQVCGSNIISGFNDSEEQRYQLERRSYRYGQTKAVRFHYPYIHELEGVVYANINKKRDRIAGEVQIMEQRYIEALQKEGVSAW